MSAKYTDQFDALFKHYLGDWWLWGKAIAIVESKLNPWALGDSGEASGLLQQHADFAKDYDPDLPFQPWHPEWQIAALGKFWDEHHGLTVQEIALRFHYRGSNPAPVETDPDNYWPRVLKAMNEIEAGA